MLFLLLLLLFYFIFLFSQVFHFLFFLFISSFKFIQFDLFLLVCEFDDPLFASFLRSFRSVYRLFFSSLSFSSSFWIDECAANVCQIVVHLLILFIWEKKKRIKSNQLSAVLFLLFFLLLTIFVWMIFKENGQIDTYFIIYDASQCTQLKNQWESDQRCFSDFCIMQHMLNVFSTLSSLHNICDLPIELINCTMATVCIIYRMFLYSRHIDDSCLINVQTEKEKNG